MGSDYSRIKTEVKGGLVSGKECGLGFLTDAGNIDH